MIEVGLVAGYLAAWAWQKARRVGSELDQDVDEVLDSGLERLHEVVTAKLGSDPALAQLDTEAGSGGQVSARTSRRVEDAVAEAVDQDEAFAALLQAIVAELARRAPSGVAVAAGDRAVAVSGNAMISADHGSAAALTAGDVSIGRPPDPTNPGQASG
jgi:hypothetical protein